MKEEEQDRVEFLESEVTRLRRERDEARFVARFGEEGSLERPLKMREKIK
jgi:hypothetical protein